MRHRRPLISVEYVSKAYDDDYLNYEQLVLRNVSLTIQQGEFVIIFGPSGSGKSTLLNMIAGLERPTAGRVLVRSHDISKYNDDEIAQYHRLKMGMVFQSFNLIKSLNVWENVALPQTADGVPLNKRFHRAKHLLKLLNVEEYVDRHPSEMSGGEQQRVAIARALINNPLILLVDEPTGNLDSKSADDVMSILKGLHEHARHTILLVTHNPEYLQFASRVIYIQDGEIKRQEYNTYDTKPKASAVPEAHFAAMSLYKDQTLADEAADGTAKHAELPEIPTKGAASAPVTPSPAAEPEPVTASSETEPEAVAPASTTELEAVATVTETDIPAEHSTEHRVEHHKAAPAHHVHHKEHIEQKEDKVDKTDPESEVSEVKNATTASIASTIINARQPVHITPDGRVVREGEE